MHKYNISSNLWIAQCEKVLDMVECLPTLTAVQCQLLGHFHLTSHSAEVHVCELRTSGAIIIVPSQLQHLYRDDALATTDQPPQNTEKIKKEICKVFKQNDLNITTEADKKIWISLSI